MSEPAKAWWQELRQDAALTAQPPPPPPRRRAPRPAIVAFVAAFIASTGVAWWLSQPDKPTAETEAVLRARLAPAGAPIASPQADPGQVRRAYEEFAAVSASGGPEALARFSESCEVSLKADPRLLDFCLAFELFAASAGGPPVAAEKQVDMVRAAAPEAAPEDRIGELRVLMRQVSSVPAAPPAQVVAQAAPAPPAPRAQMAQAPPVKLAQAAPPPPAPIRGAIKAPVVVAPPPKPAAEAVKAPVAPPPRAPAVRVAKAEPPRAAARPAAKPSAKTRAAACRSQANSADWLVCADSGLAAQHRQMRAAYERALAAGADPLAIDAGQAQWRARRDATTSRRELAELYARRIGELKAAASRPRAATPPS